jgi:hypothetical protein
MERKQLIREVMRAAGDFHARKLWKRFTNYDCFAVRLPGREEPLLASVMGDAGEQYGLMLLRGPHAADDFAALTDAGEAGDGVVENMDVLSFRMEAFGELEPGTQALYRQAGIHPKFHEQVPEFLVKPPNRVPRLATDAELSVLLGVAKAATLADRRKLLQPAELDDDEGICVLSVTGELPAPSVSVTREKPSRPARSQSHVFAASGMDLSGLKMIDATWLVATPSVPAGVEGDDRSMQLLLAADQTRGIVLQGKPFFAGEIGQAAEALVEAFRGRTPWASAGVPSRIIFSNRKLRDAMAAALQGHGVECTYAPSIPELREFSAGLLAHLEEKMTPAQTPAEGLDPETVPEADDLAAWKDLDRRLSERFASFAGGDGRLRSSRAIKRYFGNDDLDYYFDEYGQRGAAGAYLTWGVLAYRPTRNSKTLAEKMLAEGLPEAEAVLLRARMASHPSLYRVAGYDPDAGTVDFEDVLLGGGLRVHDQLLSENIDKNTFLVLRPFAAGRFHFVDCAGPPLGAGMAAEAVEFLQDLGLEFTPGGLAQDAHLFGRLWEWLDEQEANALPPHLCNMDGDDLILHTASFSVADPSAVREQLLGRKDLDFDEENDEFVWTRATGKAAEMLGGPVTLGRIEFVGDELVLTTNSAERFNKARAWLTKLPGVTFREVTTRSADEFMKDRPGDATMPPQEPMEITPEMAAGVQEMLDRQYMKWLDTPLPVFGGQTPRKACRTPDGRRRVTTLIRTMPDPVGNATVTVPRRAMLLELGLEAEAEVTAPVPPPPSTSLGRYESWTESAEDFAPAVAPIVNEGAKIGRNDPCPCGSGKKYKKCCGQ